ncbi:MAG: hypothetical protein GEV09_23305 [Pseudonocardiaceae bacterium]|nr:hypothetical protein [Pseudonocardiaceae bacterium]
MVAGYIAACAIWPFARCRWCTGSGRKRSPTGRAWRDCGHCRGTGRRIRPGRLLLTSARDTHRRGTRPDRHRDRSRSWKDSAK